MEAIADAWLASALHQVAPTHTYMYQQPAQIDCAGWRTQSIFLAIHTGNARCHPINEVSSWVISGGCSTNADAHTGICSVGTIRLRHLLALLCSAHVFCESDSNGRVDAIEGSSKNRHKCRDARRFEVGAIRDAAY
jgi:hypothetical protein